MGAATGLGGMKSRKAQGSKRTKQPAPAYTVTRDDEHTTPSTDAALLLGIPEAEFSPRARAAVQALIAESQRLTREIGQTRARLEDAARSADQDMLLPILNRRAFMREVARFISFAERYGTPSSLLYFDLDRFKTVNDVYGHEAGDAVLRHFAEIMARQIRESDVLARLGGDEFGMILAHVTLDQAKKKGARLAETLRNDQPMWNGAPIALSFAVGICELRAGEDADAAVSRADQEMYQQKRENR